VIGVQVTHILAAKGDRVATIAAGATVAEALAELRRWNVGALVVSPDGARVDGIVSERDIVRALAGAGAAVLDRRVSELARTDVVTCRLTTAGAELMATMTKRRIRHVPVVEGGRLCGIVSIGDVVKSRVDELESERDQLSDYITTGR